MSDNHAPDTSSSRAHSQSPEHSDTVDVAPPAVVDQPVPDPDPSTTGTASTTVAPEPTSVVPEPSTAAPEPTTAAPEPTTNPFPDQKRVSQKQSFVRHTPSGYNTFAYERKAGKDLAPLLVDESGMAPRFHLLANQIFSALFSEGVSPPTEEDLAKFKAPKLKKGMLEREIYPELAAVVQSVLDAAGCDKLRFLDTANHKAKDGNSGKKDTFNDGGIYANSPLAQEATNFTQEHRERSTMTAEEIASRLLGLRSWCWMDSPFEVKGVEHRAAFYFHSNPRGHKKERPAQTADPTAEASSTAEGAVEATTEVAVEGDGTGGEPGESAEMEGLEEDGVDAEGPEEAGDEDGEIVEQETAMSSVDPDVPDAATANATTAAQGAAKSDAQPETITREVPPFIRKSKEGEKALGQFVEYMLNVFKYQHRTFCYSVYVCFDMARLFLFDRGGCYVSEPFRWDNKDSLLHRFVWSIAKLVNTKGLEALGRDPTAQLADDKKEAKFMALKNDMHLPPHVREGFKKATADNCPIYEVQVHSEDPLKDEWFPDMDFPPPKGFSHPPTSHPSADPPSIGDHCEPDPSPSKDLLPSQPNKAEPVIHRFIVGRPHFAADGLVGRCTTGYMALDVTDADEKKWRPCYLKDSWRPCVPGRTRPEHLVYQRLRFYGVDKGIATLVCGGDVGGHRAQYTRVQQHLPEKNRPVPRIHYRLVIEEIGIRLEEFSSFPELSSIFVDAIRAHHKAWDLAKVLHRDISVGNIMILPSKGKPVSRKRIGILIDWDLSRLACELGIGPVEPDRTGTWQFRSILSLRFPWKPYRRSDDIESFVHAYIYLVLRFHITDAYSLKGTVMSLFEGASLINGIKVGGDGKLALFKSMELPFRIEANPELQTLLDHIILLCASFYQKIDLKQMARVYGFGDAVKEASPTAVDSVVDTESDSEDDLPFSDKTDWNFVNATLNARSTKLGSEQDPSDVQGFLSEPGDLVQLLKTHAACKRIDKCPDQFSARKHEDVYDGTTTRGLGSMSTTGTFPSRNMSSGGASFGMPLSFTSNTGSNIVAGLSNSGMSLDSKKRSRAEDNAQDKEADTSVSDGSSELEQFRVSKRMKSLATKGKTARGRKGKARG